MGRGKSRHYRDESDLLLGLYSSQIAETSSIRSYGNPLHSTHVTTASSGGDDASSLGGSFIGKVSPEKVLLNVSTLDDYDDASTIGSTRSATQQQRKKKKSSYRVHRVSYTPQNHIQVMFQMYGSAFPQVLPFCLINVIWALIVVTLKDKNIADLTFHSSVGHSFMGLLVSFLIVSRSKISYDRFMDFRRHLSTVYHNCRELVQFTTVYTMHTQTSLAKEWRQEVCYRTILLLRVTMDALLWSSTEREKWEDEYFQYTKDDQQHDIENYGAGDDNVSEHFFQFRSLTHGRRSMIDENFRAPISFSHVLKQVIMEHPHYLGYKMAVNEYRDLIAFASKINEAFHGFRVLIFTPYPFPLVQMTRTFLLFWVYSLPLVLLKDYRIWSSLLIITFVTFGFIGIEYVSIALDDPFGDDTNDVDEHGMALLVYEDIYLALYRIDGYEAAYELRERVLKRYKQGRALNCYRNDLKGYDFWELPPFAEYDNHKVEPTPEQRQPNRNLFSENDMSDSKTKINHPRSQPSSSSTPKTTNHKHSPFKKEIKM